MAEVRSYREHMILFFVKNKKKDQRPKTKESKRRVHCYRGGALFFSAVVAEKTLE